MESPYWTTKEVLRFLKISRPGLYRMLATFADFPRPKHLPGIERGKSRYPANEVIAWAEAHLK